VVRAQKNIPAARLPVKESRGRQANLLPENRAWSESFYETVVTIVFSWREHHCVQKRHHDAEHGGRYERDEHAVQDHHPAGKDVRGGFLLLKRLCIKRLMPAAQRVQKSAVRVRGVREPPVKLAAVVELADGGIQLHAFFKRSDNPLRAAAADFVGGGIAREPDGFG